MLTEGRPVRVGHVEMDWRTIFIGSEVITFTPKNDSRFKTWLIKGMYDLLARWGAIKTKYVGDQVAYRQVEISYAQLGEYLWKHVSSLEALLYQEIDYIVLGHDAMTALHIDWINRPYNFTLSSEVPFDIYKGSFHWSLAGYRIRCIPWFHGVLVVPKDVTKL